ncbi:MAG TPA: tRNA (uridine(34)/cytosine(34)/5-carboxymethylaminomethyluridine(34)-2'-O)-methyltransferase TrmL [Clostridia bacterium]|nr:tRNA (uridine(34)/cytosine(34)/5-carboxymethylaminomethyluridine(34)-2'-O)-methyltransferase TrmL [Clostridia bacterium]
MHVVLVEPEIPPNTGNIVRTCAVTGTVLHLVKPLGFSIEDKYLKRAGLDYWHLVEIHVHESLADLQAQYPDGVYYYVSTKGPRRYTEVTYQRDDFLVFGKETAGLPEDLLKQNWERVIRIPMLNEARSLNLSNSVAIVLYEGLRQQGFPNLR